MKFLKLILILFCPALLAGQNIVKNGAFQDTVPSIYPYPKYWTTPTNSSPDFYHPSEPNASYRNPLNILGYQFPKFGNGYWGLALNSKNRTDAREYLQGELDRILIKDSTYCFQMYISLADSSAYAIKNNMGVHFSSYKLDSNQIRNGLLHLTPQIEFIDSVHFIEKVAWTKLNGSFVANGGEFYLTLGNFRPDSLLDTLRINGGKQFWMESVYYYLDDIWLSHCDSLPDTTIGIRERVQSEQFQFYPNPSSGIINLESEKTITQIEMYDIHARQVKVIQQPAKQIELPEQSGVYFLRIRLENGDLLSRKVVRH